MQTSPKRMGSGFKDRKLLVLYSLAVLNASGFPYTSLFVSVDQCVDGRGPLDRRGSLDGHQTRFRRRQ